MMEKFSHTPGKWFAIPEGGNVTAIRGGDHHYPIRKMCSYWKGPGPREPEMLANATLIAAAPELLEALRELLNIRSGRTVKAARAAIAKAMGEQ